MAHQQVVGIHLRKTRNVSAYRRAQRRLKCKRGIVDVKLQRFLVTNGAKLVVSFMRIGARKHIVTRSHKRRLPRKVKRAVQRVDGIVAFVVTKHAKRHADITVSMKRSQL